MSTSTSADTVHWEQLGLKALAEANADGDTCGPIVVLDYLTLRDPHAYPLTRDKLLAMRADLIHWDLMDTPQYVGMTVGSLAAALSTHYGVQPVKVVGYDPALSFDAFHADLHAAMLAHQPVIMETAEGDDLPGNQAGVKYHYVLFGGIDSVKGYLCCNGDTYTELGLGGGGVGDPAWIGINDIAASKPCGYIILPAIEEVQQRPVSNVPLGWSDDPAKGVLTAPNKQVVVRGFRDYILGHTPVWYPGDVPLGAESADPTVNGGVWQQFRYSILRWNAKAGVTEQDRLTVLQGALDAATAQVKAASDALTKEQGVAAALSKEAADLNTQLSAANARLTQLSGIVASLITVVNALIAAVSKNAHNAQA